VSDSKTSSSVLVLEGGGLRGAFVAGVLAELERHGLRFDHIFATSAGAASAAYLVAGQGESALRIWRERTHGGQLLSVRHLLLGRRLMDIHGLVNNVFRNEITLDAERVARSSTALTVAVTNCSTGRAEYLRATADNLFSLLEATMALPVVYGRVVSIAGVPYIDGGVADAIPLDPALELDPSRVLVVSTRPLGYRKARVPIAGDWLRYNYRDFPDLWPALRTRWECYNRSIMKVEALERLGRLMVIRPTDQLPASRLTRDRRRILETLELGQAAARGFVDAGGFDAPRGRKRRASAESTLSD
jgi:predicted patatin/cPLA2 family phospholipase